MSILKASPFGPEHSERHFFRFDRIEPGCGYAITTYAGDGDPLPSFFGTPYLLSLDDPEATRIILEKLKKATIDFGRAQIEAGVDALTLPDHATGDLVSGE